VVLGKAMNKIIIYYTSNLEDENFENKVRENILKVKGDIPIISVSQKPINFGTNICVGDVGISYLNAFRQVLLGVKQAKTDYVVMAESDCLYPAKGYFDFEPTELDAMYSYTNNWILYKNPVKNKFYRKEQTHGGIIYGRNVLIETLEKSFEGLPMWSRKKMGFIWNRPKHIELFSGEPMINIITGANRRKWTATMKDEPKDILPYWGTVAEVKKKYL
jgi:hypothetical protein